MERKRKPGRSVEAESCALKAGCAKLSTWDKIVSADNPFTLVRRLCVGGSEKNADAYNFDLFDLTAQDYDISIGFMREETQVSPERYRWIPNTGEYLVLSKIQLNCYNRLGIPVPLGYDKYVVLNGAVDRDYNANDTNGNLYNNRASNFDVKIFSSSNEKFSGLMKKSSSDEKSYVIVEDAAKSNYIEIDQNGFLEDAAKPNYIKIDQNGFLEDAAKPNYIKIDQNGYLVDASSKKLISIGIRPENAANAFPGDDLRLDFSVCKYIGGSLFATLKESLLTKETDYIAVYDKKMLWRANLYIDKKEESLGGIDWNDGHPWNAPASSNTTTGTWGDTVNPQTVLASWNGNDWGYNEWNKVITYKADGTENTSTNGNGGQIIISSWTRIPTAGNEGTNVDNTVAYGYGCGDSVFDFNRGLAEQSAAMLQMKNNNTAYPPAGSFTDNQTIAPDGKWKFYIFPAETSQYKYEDIKLLDKEPADFFKRASNESKVKIPGFSTYWRDKGKYNSAQCGYTLGIDCFGLVHSSTVTVKPTLLYNRRKA